MSLKFVADQDEYSELSELKDREKILQLLYMVGDQVYYNRRVLTDEIDRVCENCGLDSGSLDIGIHQIRYGDVCIGRIEYFQEQKTPQSVRRRNSQRRRYPSSFRRRDEWMI
ncbi:MAG: hypothetical protein J4473_02940 [Candidatus Aenigmarchaeota archaeon]|nr:hypothetical protein [Candidatus Aenigmarchaeota archaeon]